MMRADKTQLILTGLTLANPWRFLDGRFDRAKLSNITSGPSPDWEVSVHKGWLADTQNTPHSQDALRKIILLDFLLCARPTTCEP